MIRKQDLEEAIAECQGQRNPSSSTAIKLAAFYTILDHMAEGTRAEPGHHSPVSSDAMYSLALGSNADTSFRYFGDSAFLHAIQGKSIEQVMAVIDELMSAVQVMNRRLYDGVMRKLEAIEVQK